MTARSRRRPQPSTKFSTAAAYRAGRVAYLPSSTFRLDYYSALEMLDAVQKAYPKAS